jgi:hypothetical protein
MNMTELEQALLVERYQRRHLTPTGEPLPAVQSFDDLIQTLRREAASGYADIDRARRESREQEKAASIARQNILLTESLQRRREAARLREEKAQQASASIQATLAAAKENERLMKEVRATQTDPFQAISAAMDSGLSLNEAIKQLGGSK